MRFGTFVDVRTDQTTKAPRTPKYVKSETHEAPDLY